MFNLFWQDCCAPVTEWEQNTSLHSGRQLLKAMGTMDFSADSICFFVPNVQLLQLFSVFQPKSDQLLGLSKIKQTEEHLRRSVGIIKMIFLQIKTSRALPLSLSGKLAQFVNSCKKKGVITGLWGEAVFQELLFSLTKRRKYWKIEKFRKHDVKFSDL